MLELSITNYQMRRPPMATNVRALNDMNSMLVIVHQENDYVKKMILTAQALDKQQQVHIDKDASGTTYTLNRNFMGSVGTLYLRENRKLHFEVETPYVEEIEIKAFFSKKVEKRHHVACLTGVVPFTFDHLVEIRISGNRITFTFSQSADGKGPMIPFGFEMADVRQFARDLYEWAERKGFKLLKPVDDDYKENTDKAPAPPPPPDGTLYSVIIAPNNITVEYGTATQFTARPVDVKGQDLPGIPVQWTVTPPLIGTITPAGLFTPSTDSAQCSVVAKAQVGDISTHGYASVSVVPKPVAHHAPAAPQGQLPPPPPPPAPGQPLGKFCGTCRDPLVFNQQYNRWYCARCQKWE